jgi:hypothetical protein
MTRHRPVATDGERLRIQGRFVDVPLGSIFNTGELTLQCPNFFTLDFVGGSSLFGARHWDKMREAGVVGPPVAVSA